MISPKTLTRGLVTAGCLAGVAGLSILGGCDGSSSSSTADSSQIVRPSLLDVQYGRLVDVYAYRRADAAISDRRDSRNRVPVLIEQNVVISTTVSTDELFDAIGGEREAANYRFLPFDATVGHEELLILWDDQDPVEGIRFQNALTSARSGLTSIAASYRNQDTTQIPVPVVPRNAAIKLVFDRGLGKEAAFYAANPGAIQLLQFIDDPGIASPADSFLPATYRILPTSDGVIIDTTLIGAESSGGTVSTGLAASEDSQTANFRLAIPTSGVVSRLLNVDTDVIPQLNDIDSLGNPAVIRDFRSGNPNDGLVGSLSDGTRPTILGRFDMGITSLDRTARTITINKRGNLVAMRGRIPFVDGAVIPATGVPGGTSTVPTVNESLNREPLAAGDSIVQQVTASNGEILTIRAEVVQNMDVGAELGDAQFPAPGLTVAGTDGGELPIATVRLDRVSAFASNGEEVFLNFDDVNPLGSDCVVSTRYYEFVPYSGEFGISASVSDAQRRQQFMLIDPPPTPPAGALPDLDTQRFLSPSASLGLRFSEPMDLPSINTLDNMVYSTEDVDAANFRDVLASPKSATLSFLPSRVVDQDNNGTSVKLLAPLGHYHDEGDEEAYWMHVLLEGVTDLSGNILDIYDRRQPGDVQVSFKRAGATVTEVIEVPLQSFSVQFEMLADAPKNLIGTKIYRFAAGDEDGTASGSIDFFGQYRITEGRLLAAETQRFSAAADQLTMSAIDRFNKGECFDFVSEGTVGPINFSGLLYDTPDASQQGAGLPTFQRFPQIPTSFANDSPLFGGITEPHVRRGSRLQMTLREDDLGLSYTDVNQLNIDIEAMHWAPWIDQPAYFDQFDDYSISLGHSDKRPDLLFYYSVDNEECEVDCASSFSSLNTEFASNVLQGSSMQQVVNETTYTVNPTLAFRNPASGVKYVPYPEFESTYTWRDSRLVKWDPVTESVVGLGGATNADADPGPLPQGQTNSGNRTASISSPWVPDDPTTSFDGAIPETWPFQQFVRDTGDFLGDVTRDHDPIALPLLIEFRVSPDTTTGEAATSNNLWWMGYVGAPYVDPTIMGSPGGYYNQGGGWGTVGDTFGRAACGAGSYAYPYFRVHSTGGIDLVTLNEVFVQPDDAMVATGGVIFDKGMGRLPHDALFQTPPGDDHVPYTQLDFVRKTSIVTAGFFDTRKPNQYSNGLTGQVPPLPGLPPTIVGRPDIDAVGGSDLGVDDFIVLVDPLRQPGGTSLVVEVRGADHIGAEGVDPTLYDPLVSDNETTRGNLLNPKYACEAYRYSLNQSSRNGPLAPRVPVDGITQYVDSQNVDALRNPQTSQLPRYINLRFVMENNVDSNPAVSPGMRHAAVVYRITSTAD